MRPSSLNTTPAVISQDDSIINQLAVLIDADNAQASAFESILAEISGFGEITVKRIYGDFTDPQSNSWKSVLNKLAIKPVQQFAYTTGKNATDSTMIIDAMDLLYTQRFDGFCIVSSDSDFTGLAIRIKEQGLKVYGFGEKKTPASFRNACHKFVYVENLLKPDLKEQDMVNNTHEVKEKTMLPLELFRNAFQLASDDSGWAQLGTFGSHITRLSSEFDSRTYGYKKLSTLVRENPAIFEFQDRKDSSAGMTNIYLRLKE